MVQDNKLIDNLINPTHQKKAWHKSKVVSGAKEDEVLITSDRVVNTRYRVYTLLLFIFCLLMFYYLVEPAYNQFTADKQQMVNIENQISGFDSTINMAKNKIELLGDIESNSGDIVECIDFEKNCDDIPNSIYTWNIELAKDFLNMNNLKSETFQIDEKSILTNLNEFMLKYDPVNSSRRNWVVQSISIGDEESYDKLYDDLLADFGKYSKVNANDGSIVLETDGKNIELELIKYVPINVSVEFENEDAIISFVENVENFVVPNYDISKTWSNKEENRILYVIDNISYDVANYEETQIADIEMYIFYTK